MATTLDPSTAEDYCRALVEEAVASELLEHVVEHADPGRDLVATGAVEVEREGDAGLARPAFDVGPSATWQRRLRSP